VTAYALAFGSLLLVGGRLGDMYSRKWVFITGLAGFALASALGGAAVSFGMLVAARALQGAFGAILAPSALGTLVSTFQDPRERGRAFGVFGSVAAGGGAVGLILGGALTQYLSWRYTLYVNLVFAVIAIAGALVYIRTTRSATRPRMDWPGAILACAGLFLIVFGFSHAETAGWSAALTIGSLVAGALAVAVIVLVQGAGVAEAAPNPDGTSSDANRDIIAQGAANLASGFFRGVLVGGSVGQTALNVRSGARTRWASIWSGLWMLVILVAFSGLVAKVALPTLGAILIFAAVGSLRFGEVATILRTGLTSRIAVITTFAATLFLPVAAAVGIGVALSLLLQLNTEAMDLKVVELLPREDGRFEERGVPSSLTSDHVTILDVYGSLLYAGTRTLQARLPDPAGAEAPVVILRLRGRTSLGSTFIKLVGDYADRLDEVGGRLYLSGLQPSLTEQLDRTGSIEGPVRAFKATAVVGESTQAAYLDAEAWLVRRHDRETPAG